MTNPWNALDAATGAKKLYLDHTVVSDVNSVYTPYEAALQNLIDDGLDDTAAYFGTNSLADVMGKAFNARGKMLTEYLKEQQSQASGFVKTVRDAANAQLAAEGD